MLFESGGASPAYWHLQIRGLGVCLIYLYLCGMNGAWDIL